MSVKTKLGLGIASAALGLSLIGGGTFAYFNDTAETNATFAAGTLKLDAKPTTIVDVQNLKPGDTMLREFKLINDGSLDIANVLLTTAYDVIDLKGDNAGDDFGRHIKVQFLDYYDKTENARETVIAETTLAELKNMNPDVVNGNAIEAGEFDWMLVKFVFVDNGEDQNQFQGDSINLTWTFDGKQGVGEAR